jgi:hypothetical protein
MKQQLSHRHLRTALALGIALVLHLPQALAAAAADDEGSTLNIGSAPVSAGGVDQPTANIANLDARLDVNQDPKLRAYNEIMYLYNLGDHFGALTTLLTYKANKVFSDDDDSSQTLLGDLYTELGLPEQAEAIFSRAITRDTISATRNRTWFDKGRLQYLRGNYTVANKVLSDDQHNLSSDDDHQRRIMLANVLIQSGQFSQARHVLEPVPLSSTIGAYATYNMGVASLNSGRPQEGMVSLWRVMNLPVGNNETNALKDRAALALGYAYLKQKQPSRAHDALVNVRLDGPFSNPAMLALGYSHYEQKDFKHALSFWLELAKRNPADGYVEESLLLAPRAYEEVGAKQQALTGYQLAATTFQNQLSEIESLTQILQQPNWLEVLSPATSVGNGGDPLVPVDTTTASNKRELPYLYQKLASNQFNEAFKQYEQLRRLDGVMSRRADDLDALKDQVSNLNNLNGSHFADGQGRLRSLAGRYDKMQKKWDSVQLRAQDLGNNADDFAQTASVEDQARDQHLQTLKNALDKAGYSPAADALRLRLARLQGLSVWMTASSAPLSQVDMQRRLQEASADMIALQVRLKAIKALQADNRTVLDSHAEARINQLAQRVGTARTNLARAQEEYRTYMRKLAVNVLAERKSRLNNDLAEAYLNVARLQDQALLKEDNPGSARGSQP